MLTLKEWRRAKGISQEAIAADVGVHANTYIAWEKDPYKIPFGKAVRIAEILGVPFTDINFIPEKSTKISRIYKKGRKNEHQRSSEKA